MKTKSFNPNITDEQLERQINTTSFLSFERAIRQTEEINGLNRKIKGYSVTEQGIVIILED